MRGGRDGGVLRPPPAGLTDRLACRNMKELVLSRIGYSLGEARPIHDLQDDLLSSLCVPEHGLEQYRRSEEVLTDLALAAAEASLSGSAGLPDLVLHVSESEPDRVGALFAIERKLGLPGATYYSIGGRGCANFGMALDFAISTLGSGMHNRVLLILADRAGPSRVVEAGLSVLSDGAAACVLTTHAEERGSDPMFVLSGSATMHDALAGAGSGGATLNEAWNWARGCGRRFYDQAGIEPSSFAHVLLPNYRLSSQQFLAAAFGFRFDQIRVGDVAGVGHCFAADPLINLHALGETAQLSRDEHILLVASARGVCSFAAVKCL